MTKKETKKELKAEENRAVVVEVDGYLMLLDMRNTNNENGYRQSALYMGKTLIDKKLTNREKINYACTIEDFCFMIDKKADKTNNPIRKYFLSNENGKTDELLKEAFEIQIIDIDSENKIDYPNINEKAKLWLELFSCANFEELEAIKHKSEMMYKVVTEIQEFSKKEGIYNE